MEQQESTGMEALAHLETLLRQGGATLPRACGCACAPRTGRSGNASVRVVAQTAGQAAVAGGPEMSPVCV